MEFHSRVLRVERNVIPWKRLRGRLRFLDFMINSRRRTSRFSVRSSCLDPRPCNQNRVFWISLSTSCGKIIITNNNQDLRGRPHDKTSVFFQWTSVACVYMRTTMRLVLFINWIFFTFFVRKTKKENMPAREKGSGHFVWYKISGVGSHNRHHCFQRLLCFNRPFFSLSVSFFVSRYFD